jgi:hypothetical protein
MSNEAIGPVSSIEASDTHLAAQLHRDQQQLLADTKAKASQRQLAADHLAITRDRHAITQNTRFHTDSYV